MNCCINSCQVTKEKFGILIKISGNPTKRIYDECAEEIASVVDLCGRKFNAIIDLRNLKTHMISNQEITTFVNAVSKWKAYLVGKGLKRLGILYTSNSQIDALFRLDGTGRIEPCEERAISAMVTGASFEAARAWAECGIEPR